MTFVRFQSPDINHHGIHVGVFGLVNTLAKQGVLTDEEEQFRRANNDWYDANYPNPSNTDPAVYDHDLNPGAVAWFKSCAVPLIKRVDGYLRILAAHGVACDRVESVDPGRVIYEDADQIVVVPADGTRQRDWGDQRE